MSILIAFESFLKLFNIDINKFDKKKSFKGKLIGWDKELRHIVSAKKNAKIRRNMRKYAPNMR